MSRNFVRVLILAVLTFALAECNSIAVPLSELNLNKNAPQPQVMDAESRIVNGEVAKGATAPYIASLSLSLVVYAHICSCVIISKEWLLTAAHCIQNIEKSEENRDGIVGLPVYAGLIDRTNLENAQMRLIDFAFAHKRFNGLEGSDDIAMLHVSSPFQFNDNVRSIALPMFHEDFSGELSTTYGWGLDNTDSLNFVKDLRVARADVINHKNCRKAMPAKAPVSPRTICVRVASCYGDGGSPLVIERNGKPLELIGITSWAYIPCGYEKRPTAFMAISHYVDWIAEVQWAYSILH